MTQDNALAIMKMGKSIYLTGGAGSGKTYVLNAFIKYLNEHDIDVAITASTGIAATHIGGMTIHAWSGIGIRDNVTDWDIEMMEEKKYLWDRYDKVKVLIIDEISMLSGTFLDTLDRICRAFKRKPELPFGGIQVILCGDLFQLPPVTKKGEPVSMVIDSKVWKTMNPIICYLSEQHRQDDEIFTDILNAIRQNNVQDYHLETLEERIREYSEDDFQNVTKLFTHNADVDTINNQQLASIDEEEFVFYMESKGKENLIETLKKSCLAPETLILKLGSRSHVRKKQL
jgi:ATP-dependent exoDNAse (exonuclease V) alpha subunit